MIVRSTPSSRCRAVIVALAVLGSVALLAACSSSAKSSTASSQTSSGSALKLTFLLDDSGPQSVGEGDVATKVAKAWLDYTNGHGGVAGHTVSLAFTDTKGDPATGQAAATQAVGDASTLGAFIVDAAGESSFAKTLSDGKLPVLGGLGYYPTVWSALPNVFGITTTFPSVVNMQPLAAQKVGAKSTGVAACAEVDSCAAAGAVYKAAADKLGLRYTGTVKVAVSATSFTAECLQFINAKTDFIQFSAGSAVGVRLFQDCRQQGYTGYLGASAGTVSAALYNGDPNVKLAGALNSFPWWVDAAPVRQYRDIMTAAGVSGNDYGAPTATATYASLELFKKAMNDAKATLPSSPTRADVLAAYGAVKNETLGGLLPQPLTFTAGKPSPKVTCFWLYTFQNGKFAGDFTPTCDTAS